MPSVYIDEDELFAALSDKELLQEVKDRKLKLPSDPDWQAVAEAAYDYLCHGNIEDAKLALERALRPKWASAQMAADALAKARQAHA